MKGEIPPGTLATAAREADDPFGGAETVLRDAYNHADAIGLTKAETAILLGPGDGTFSQWVAAIVTEKMEAQRVRVDGGVADGTNVITAAQLSNQLVDLLAMLEVRGRPADLRSFALSLVGLLEGIKPLVLFGLALASYPLLKAAGQARDLADTEFSGPQWPFRYVWDTGPRPGRHTKLLDLP